MNARSNLQSQKTLVMGSTPVGVGLLQRKCACGQHTIGGECQECRQKHEGMIQRAAVSAASVNSVLPMVHDVLSSSGQPLDNATRAFMEPRFGHDFSSVRVHTDARAAESARAVNALAYTVGRNIVFGSRQYEPRTSEGRRLMAHELTHVVQQESSISTSGDVSSRGDSSEHEANRVAPIVSVGQQASVKSPTSLPPLLQRQEKDFRLPEPTLRLPPRRRLGLLSPGEELHPPTEEDLKTKAHQAVEEFRKSTRGGKAWPNLSRSVIADGLEERIDNPSLINQSVLNVCGPAVIVHMLASNDPVRFVQIVQILYEQGQVDIDGETLSADADLRKNSPPDKMAQVDWMLMSSMRDSENAIFDFEGTAKEDFSGITTPSEIAHWMRSMLKCKNTVWESAYLYGEIDVIRKASEAVSAGKSVALLIDVAMLSNLPKEGKVGYPNHWVILKSPVTETKEPEEKVHLSIWTWGEKDFRKLDPDRKVFIKTFYGAVICTL